MIAPIMLPAMAIVALLEAGEDSEACDVNIVVESAFWFDTCVVVPIGTDGEVLFEESEGYESEFSSM